MVAKYVGRRLLQAAFILWSATNLAGDELQGALRPRFDHLSFANWSLIISPLLALIDWLAVARQKKRLEYVFKPATLVAIIIGAWLLTQGPHDAWEARFFLPGLVFSLAGDVFLMLPGAGAGSPSPYFLPGLVAFLLAHLCYIVGLNPTLPPWPALAILIVVVVIGITLFRPIAAGMRRQGKTAMLVPVALYSLVLSLMLFSAWATLFRPEWTSLRRGLIIVGASLFSSSDAMLAWDMFISPSLGLQLLVITTYHLGQIAMAASIALAR